MSFKVIESGISQKLVCDLPLVLCRNLCRVTNRLKKLIWPWSIPKIIDSVLEHGGHSPQVWQMDRQMDRFTMTETALCIAPHYTTMYITNIYSLTSSDVKSVASRSKFWPRPQRFGLGLASISLSYYVFGHFWAKIE